MTAEALYAPESDREGWTAQPPQTCLNGCETRQSDEATSATCLPGHNLCTKCSDRLDKWLRTIPDHYALLPAVLEHGTVPSDPGTKHTKRPDPPAPMRLEVIDLLDTRPGCGVLAVVHSWAELVRDERHDTRHCACDHVKMVHVNGGLVDGAASQCTGVGCDCQRYRPVDATVSRECAYLITNLAWATGRGFAGDLYDEIRVLARTLSDTVGEYRPKPVGKCAALIDLPSTGTAHSILQGVCGGALVMDREGTGVHCLKCAREYSASLELRALGLIVDQMFIHKEAS